MSKVRKNISISEEAAEKLDEQSNASQYIEDLILGKIERKAPWKDLEYRIDRLEEAIKTTIKIKSPEKLAEDIKGAWGEKPADTSIGTTQPPKTRQTRSKSVIKRDIDDTEAEREEELEYVQDREVRKEISDRYQEHIDALWAEFHAS